MTAFAGQVALASGAANDFGRSIAGLLARQGAKAGEKFNSWLVS
jgi:hypothetical protein